MTIGAALLLSQRMALQLGDHLFGWCVLRIRRVLWCWLVARTRASSQWAYIGVHQITTIYQKVRISYRIEYKMVNGKKTEVSRKEVGRKPAGQRSSTKLGKKSHALP